MSENYNNQMNGSSESYEYNNQQYQVYGTGQYVTSESEKSNGMAIASLVLGICSLACCCVGIPFSVVGLVFGIIARKNDSSNNMALVGIILSVVGIIVFTMSFIFGFILNYTATPVSDDFIPIH